MIGVTGADGFIGSHLVEHLVADGRPVRALVQYNALGSRGWMDDVPSSVRDAAEVVAFDVRDFHSVRDALRGCDSVLHLAALIAIPWSYASPASYVDTNVTGTLNVLQAARELELGRVVQVSTSEVYGTARFVPITEEHPLRAQSPYAASKIAADQLTLAFQASFGVPVAVVRPFNTYGPRQSARAVIPAVMCQLAAGRRRVRLGALHPTRDFSYVADTVRGLVAALDAEAAIGRVVQLGSGFEISIADLVETIGRVMGTEVEVELEPERLRPERSEVERLWADVSLAREVLDWTPEYTGPAGLERGLELTAKWLRDPANLRRYAPDRYVR